MYFYPFDPSYTKVTFIDNIQSPFSLGKGKGSQRGWANLDIFNPSNFMSPVVTRLPKFRAQS